MNVRTLYDFDPSPSPERLKASGGSAQTAVIVCCSLAPTDVLADVEAQTRLSPDTVCKT